jgi:hypothetical protein
LEDEDTKLPPAEFERSFPVVCNKNRLNVFKSLYEFVNSSLKGVADGNNV